MGFQRSSCRITAWRESCHIPIPMMFQNPVIPRTKDDDVPIAGPMPAAGPTTVFKQFSTCNVSLLQISLVKRAVTSSKQSNWGNCCVKIWHNTFVALGHPCPDVGSRRSAAIRSSAKFMGRKMNMYCKWKGRGHGTVLGQAYHANNLMGDTQALALLKFCLTSPAP